MKEVLFKILPKGILLYVAIGLPFSCNVPRYPAQTVNMQLSPDSLAINRGKVLVNLMCADCHRNPTTGKLSGKYLPDVPKVMGRLYSSNITQHTEKGIGSYTAGELAYLLRTGVAHKGNFTPIMAKPGLSDSDLRAIIAYLKYSEDVAVAPADRTSPPSQYSLPAKIAMRMIMKPFDYPMASIPSPSTGDVIAQGRYLVNIMGCFDCHSSSLTKVDKLRPEQSKGYLGGGAKLKDIEGDWVRTPNITMDSATGIGRWSRQDFVRALKDGIRPDRTVLKYPMPNYNQLTQPEVEAIYAYLKTVPTIRNRVKPNKTRGITAPDLVPDTLIAGKQAYTRYGCQTCHGNNGIGIADLRTAHQKYPDDTSLSLRIRNPSAFNPASRMPKFEGVVAEGDYAQLVAYVRWLGKAKGQEEE